MSLSLSLSLYIYIYIYIYFSFSFFIQLSNFPSPYFPWFYHSRFLFSLLDRSGLISHLPSISGRFFFSSLRLYLSFMYLFFLSLYLFFLFILTSFLFFFLFIPISLLFYYSFLIIFFLFSSSSSSYMSLLRVTRPIYIPLSDVWDSFHIWSLVFCLFDFFFPYLIYFK